MGRNCDTDGWPVPPMLAESAPCAFDSPLHLFEVKWDGYRCIAHIYGPRVRLQSRNLKDITLQFPQLMEIQKAIRGNDLILDGEVIALRDGVPDFSALRNRERPPVYVAFDILRREREWLFEMPLVQRKEMLREVVDVKTGSARGIVVPDFVEKNGIALFEAVSGRGLEGIVAKEILGVYRPGVRSRSWLKIRNSRTLDAVICGYTKRAGGGLGALILGLRVGKADEMRYVGFVGTGFSEKEGEEILSTLHPSDEPVFGPDDIGRIERSRRGGFERVRLGAHGLIPRGIENAPYAQESPKERPHTGDIRWVKPEVVCEIRYTEVTPDGVLRHPVYVRLRPDKNAIECTLERVGGNRSLDGI